MRILPPILLVAAGIPGLAQNRCAEFDLKPIGGPTGYDWRENRCEGEFIQNVAGSSDLRLVSFGSPIDTAMLTGSAPIKLAWKTTDANLRIRAESLKSRHYYRMDAKPGAVGAFQWTTGILSQFRLKGDEIGLVAWVGAGKENRYVPLEVNGVKGLAFMVRPGAQLNEVYVTLRSEAGVVLVRDKPLGLGVYPAERAFRVALPKVPAAGWYRMELAATLQFGGSANNTFVVQLPAN